MRGGIKIPRGGGGENTKNFEKKKEKFRNWISKWPKSDEKPEGGGGVARPPRSIPGYALVWPPPKQNPMHATVYASRLNLVPIIGVCLFIYIFIYFLLGF